jgi:hypothetical protein
MLDAICQTNRPMLHGLRPPNAHDEPLPDISRASTSNVLIIDEHPCRMSERLRTALALPEYQVQVAITSPGAALRPNGSNAVDAQRIGS